VGEFLKAFRALVKMPVALWLVIWAYSIDAMAYFGVLTLMKPYLHDDIGLSGAWSSVPVSLFTGGITLCWMAFGGIAEKMGPRKGMILALVLSTSGRLLFSYAMFMGSLRLSVLLFSLLIVAIAEGMVQSAAYAGIKQYTDEKTSSMGYAMSYALMNVAIVLIGLISPLVRVPYEAAHESHQTVVSGIDAVNWTCAGVTGIGLVVYVAFMTKKREDDVIRGPAAVEPNAPVEPKKGALRRFADFFVGKGSPFLDLRFVFFVFMLMPVRTLFAHQWLTMPDYILGAYPKEVGDKMEWIVNWINPGIIFFGVPTITAMTKRFNVYTMMIVGTTVSAASTYLLCITPNLTLLITYMVLFSIGEALWSARFLEYAAELAPEGRLSQYMGLANIPWLLAKATTGLYSGWLLEKYCPEQGVQNTQMLWLIYGLIATSTPVGLIIARRWVMKGLKTKAPALATA
jgi:proton-dependent oligopeptide transporter, POT family